MQANPSKQAQALPARAFTIEQFAERWRIGRNSVYNAIARGELKTIKIGNRRLVTCEQEEAFRRHMESAA